MSSKWAKVHPTNCNNVYYSQARRQDFAGGGPKITRGAHFLNKILTVCSNGQEKSRLRHVNFIYLDPESYADMNAEPAEHRDLLFCHLGKGRDKK